MTIDECLGDVQSQRGPSLGSHEIEPERDKEGINGKDADIVGKGLDEGKNSGIGTGSSVRVRSRRVNRNHAVDGVASDVDRAEVVSGATSGLEESCDEFAGGRDRAEVGP